MPAANEASKAETVVHVVAEIRAKPGHEKELQALLEELVASSRREEGCTSYHLHVDVKEPGTFFTFEAWASDAALKTHLAGLGPVVAKATPFFASPPRITPNQADRLTDRESTMGALSIAIGLPVGSGGARAFEEVLRPLGDAVSVEVIGEAFPASALANVEILVAQRLADDALSEAKSLRWLSSVAAGLDGVATPALLARHVAVTSASGVHGPNMAEHVLGMMLMFTRGLHRFMRAQVAGKWDRAGFARDSDRLGELAGQTLAIVGVGRIGEALATRAKAFDLRVVGVKRDVARRYDESVGLDAIYPLAELDAVLAQADHVCLALPLTPETTHLFDARRLAQMKRGAYLYNVARGPIVDESALVTALETGALGGAGLDVFEHEPLPSASPLWSLENVILTPHIAGVTPRYYERAARLFAANLARFRGGEPLLNRFDPARGY